MSTQTPRRFDRYDFAIGDQHDRATVLDLDRIDPTALPIVMDGILDGRKIWGPWRDSPLRIPAQIFVTLAAIAELLLIPHSLRNLMTVMVDPAVLVTPSTVAGLVTLSDVALLVLPLAALPVMLWLMLGEGGVTGADAAISLSLTAAEGDDESIDHIRTRWAAVRKTPGVRQEDIGRARTLAYNAQVQATFHLHMRTSAGEDAAELGDLAKARDAALETFDAEVDRLHAEAHRRQRIKQMEAQLQATAQITSARTTGVAPVGLEPDGILTHVEEPAGNAHNTAPVTAYEQPPNSRC